MRPFGLTILLLSGAMLVSQSVVGDTYIREGNIDSIIDKCIEKLLSQQSNNSDEEEENNSVQVICPALSSLLQSPNGRQITPQPGESISVSQLLDIKQALILSPKSKNGFGVPSTQDLNSFLQQIINIPADNQPDDKSWWDEFVKWLSDKLQDERGSGNTNAFLDWLKSIDIPQWVGPLILKIVALLLIVVLVIILATELRALSWSNYFRSKKTEIAQPSGHYQIKRQSLHKLSLQALQALPPRLQVIALLNRIRHYLHERKIVEDNYSYTHEEYLRLVRSKQPEIYSPLTQLVRWVNVSLFSQHEISRETSEQLREAVLSLETD